MISVDHELIVYKQHNQKMEKQSVVQAHVFSDVSVDKLNNKVIYEISTCNGNVMKNEHQKND